MKQLLLTLFLSTVTVVIFYAVSKLLGIPVEFMALGGVSYLFVKDFPGRD